MRSHATPSASGTRRPPRSRPGEMIALFALRRAGLGVLRTAPAYLAASVAGAALLYVVMMYLVLPWANSLMCHMTPRGPFFIGHLIYGLIFGLVAYPLARRAAASGT